MHGTQEHSTIRGLADDEVMQQVCVDVWREKYRYNDEPDYAATCARVVAALCANESAEFRKAALRAMIAREIIPAGRILAGAGTKKRVTLINCFVSPYIQDSMATHLDRPGKGIMDSLADAAYSLQMGGGIGMDFSTIRPRGAVVKRTGSTSSGVLPFMDMWNAMSETIMSAGHRRGAMMGTLRCDHPDIEEFIEAKQQRGRLENFNVSILVTDAFMQAVAEDKNWHLVFDVPPSKDCGGNRLISDDRGVFYHGPSATHGHVYKTVRARDLWEKITAATYMHAEPGVIFIDRVNEQNNLSYCETIHACNPCGEQMLPDSGACNLGHVNLAAMVINPFTEGALFDVMRLRTAAEIMVRLLDNVLDVTQWPTREQKKEGRAKRRIGLGFTGLASALQQLGIPYGSDRAVKFTNEVMRNLAVAAYRESCELARLRGPFPAFDAANFCEAPFVRRLDEVYEVIDGIRKHGIRNGVLLSIAPTGTTSLMAGNISSGIEPVFAHRYRRRVRAENGAMEAEYSVFDYGYLKYCAHVGANPEEGADLPAAFVTADQLTVEQHLRMAVAAQEWVDSAISKTINCPASMSLGEFREVYRRAYDFGLKGCTTYRPDPRSARGAVLISDDRKEVISSGSEEEGARGGQGQDRSSRQGGSAAGGIDGEEAAQPKPLTAAPRTDDKIPMQEVVDARRYRIKWPTEDCSYYVIITDYLDASGRRRPFELFISTKSERHSEWVKAFSLLVTAIFRREGDPAFVVDELRSVFSAGGGAWVRVPWEEKSKLAPSLVAAIGLKIEEHLRWLELIPRDEILPKLVLKMPEEGTMPAAELLDVCDTCGARAVIYSEGCATCHACGRSDCG